MKIRFQSMHVPVQLTSSAMDATCYAINRYGDGAHPMANYEELPHFGFRYVIRCVTKLACSQTNSEAVIVSALEALDQIKLAVNHNRAARNQLVRRTK